MVFGKRLCRHPGKRHFLLQPGPRQQTGERLRGNELKRLGDLLQLVAEGDADPFAAVVKGEDAHVV
jgi:hypothetical protein